MIKKNYTVQKLSHVYGHWTLMLEKDKELFGIVRMSDSEAKAIPQIKFKNYIKKKAQQAGKRIAV